MHRPTSTFLALAAFCTPCLAQEPEPALTPASLAAPPARSSEPAAEFSAWDELLQEDGPLSFYGFLRMDAYFNTARASNVIIPATVLPENGVNAKPNDNQFALDPRLTRFGAKIDGGSLGDTSVAGRLEVDFANFPGGVPESRPTPRIRLAYIDIGGEESGLRIGQDWDVISPLYPAVNHELLMWNAGNLGDRRSQIQAFWRPHSAGDSQFELRTSLGLTGAINNQDLDPVIAPGTPFRERDGFDSGLPHLQARAGMKFDGLVDDQQANVGAWGMFGLLQTDNPINGSQRFDSWTGGVDFTFPITSELTARGEVWTGQALGDVRGGIGQTINVATGAEIESLGGFAELWLKTSDSVRFHLGTSVDDPDNGQLVAGNPELNRSVYVGTVIDWDIGIRNGFDIIYWETDWMNLGQGNMVRFDFYFQLDF